MTVIFENLRKLFSVNSRSLFSAKLNVKKVNISVNDQKVLQLESFCKL